MKLFFKKTILSALLAAFALASLPLPRVSAAGQIANERLERIWARQLRLYERLGHTDEFIARVQRLIDRAEADGKDVSAVQAALDVFAARVTEAHPIYESMKGIVNAHLGFDSSGNVTDTEKATETVQAMHGKLQEIKSVMNGSGKALREAIRALRQSSPHPQPTSTPTGG